jgi:hypothetical protein
MYATIDAKQFEKAMTNAAAGTAQPVGGLPINNSPLITPNNTPQGQGNDYPVFGSDLGANLPDPKQYANAMSGAFSNLWGGLQSMLQGSGGGQGQQAPAPGPGIRVSEPRPAVLNGPMAEEPSAGGAATGSLSPESQTAWYGAPWLFSGAKQSQNQFQNQMSSWGKMHQQKSQP